MLITSAPEACRNSRRDIEFMAFSSGSRSGGALDRAHDRHVGAAAALESRERFTDLGIVGLGVVAQERGRGHDPAGEAVAALRNLLLDVSGLQRMWLLRRAKPGECRDLLAGDGADGHHAGTSLSLI